jgi:hypothetical protein
LPVVVETTPRLYPPIDEATDDYFGFDKIWKGDHLFEKFLFLCYLGIFFGKIEAGFVGHVNGLITKRFGRILADLWSAFRLWGPAQLMPCFLLIGLSSSPLTWSLLTVRPGRFLKHGIAFAWIFAFDVSFSPNLERNFMRIDLCNAQFFSLFQQRYKLRNVT